MIHYCMIDGELLPLSEAAIGVTDLGLLRGYGMFDFFLVKEGEPLFVEDYLDRFWRSARQMKIDVPLDRDELIDKINQLLDANGLRDASIRLVLTGGYSQDGYTPQAGKANLLILEHPFPNYPAKQYEEGIALLLHAFERQFPTIKTTNYLAGILMRDQLMQAGADDLLFHTDGKITETTRANFFLVLPGNVIVTAEDGILEGITRKYVLRLANRHYRIEKRRPTVEELGQATEAFVTSSTKRVMPVVRIDDVIIGNGKPGSVTRHLFELLKEAENFYLSSKSRVK